MPSDRDHVRFDGDILAATLEEVVNFMYCVTYIVDASSDLSTPFDYPTNSDTLYFVTSGSKAFEMVLDIQAQMVDKGKSLDEK